MEIKGIKIRLASPDQIRKWSRGEVKKPETINYRTLRPERDGLFCERIFGPTRDYECYCGKYKHIKYKGIVCERCGVEVTESRVRRERMGHIELAVPVVHIWYLKGIPSKLSLLLGIPSKDLEKVVYFASLRRKEQLYKVMSESRGVCKRGDIITGSQFRIHSHFDKQFAAEEAYRVTDLTEIPLEKGEVITSRQLERLKSEFGNMIDGEPCYEILEIDSTVTGVTYKVGDLLPLSELETIKAKFGASKVKAEPFLIKGEETYIVTKVLKMPFKKGDFLGASEYELYRKKYGEKFKVRLETSNLEESCYIVINPGSSPFRLGDIIIESEYELCKKYDPSFEAGVGAEAVKKLLQNLDLDLLAEELRLQIKESTGQRRSKLIKRLEVVEAFKYSGNKPEWMVLDVLPVIPPELRPMVQLDGGRFATSDLNDLYRRVINRNNRLKKLLALKAPEIIVRNEKRMLQEAVDALLDNGRRARPVVGPGNRPLKSLTDMLRGKKGRFRQNLLGKRVDYSGRSVIVVGPELKLYQCGLPRQMAIELFKPFVKRRLVEKGIAPNIKSARKMIERGRPEVWDVLEEVVKEHPVLLNRAPTLHRLSIQAFEPVLMEGKAIRIHPLVCTAYNADFDGDQMAVHVPLSYEAQAESRIIMLSANNLLSPASGGPIVTPTQDMVIGCYYLTIERSGVKGEGRRFVTVEEALIAYEHGTVHLHAPVFLRAKDGYVVFEDGKVKVEPIEDGWFKTTMGRIYFNTLLPKELRFINEVVDKKKLASIVEQCYRECGQRVTVELLDRIKETGFHMATKMGLSVSITDVHIPSRKLEIVKDAEEKTQIVDERFKKGVITEEERIREKERIWSEVVNKLTDMTLEEMDIINPFGMMVSSGARGSRTQLGQMAGIRGLMMDPSGRVIEFPIRSNFREGLSVLEYFISTHGARKGLADTALRTAKSGYLTRRLVDVAHDIIINAEDCGTDNGIEIAALVRGGKVIIPLEERIIGRYAVEDVANPNTGGIIVRKGEEITEEKAKIIVESGIKKVKVRSPLTCALRYGICAKCYGRNLATMRKVDIGEAVGIVAAQSIGEPGTQLTMRTFHTGGIRTAEDITQGLPRAEQLFEVRRPKKAAFIAEFDGVVIEIKQQDGRYKLTLEAENGTKKVYSIPATLPLLVDEGDEVKKGELLTEGDLDPQEILAVQGINAVQRYLVDQIQMVYRSQGVSINDKHIETIIRKIVPPNKVRVLNEGDTHLLPGEIIYTEDLEAIEKFIDLENKRILEDNISLLVGKKVAETVKDKEEGGIILHKGDILEEDIVVGLSSSDCTIKEIAIEDEGEDDGSYIRMIFGELEFSQSVLNKILAEPVVDANGSIIAREGEILTRSLLNRILESGIRQVCIRDESVFKDIIGEITADPIVDLDTGAELIPANTLITGEHIDLIRGRRVKDIRVWRRVEHLSLKSKLKERLLTSVLGGTFTAPLMDGDKVIFKEGFRIDSPEIVSAIIDANPGAIEVDGKLIDILEMKMNILTDEVYGKILAQPLLTKDGKEAFPVGQELNQKVLQEIARLPVDEIVVRSLLSGVETYKVEQKVGYAGRQKRKPIVRPLMQGITKAALTTESFLSAASFQQTAQVLTSAAVRGAYDPLIGLKENVIIGHLIPAGTGIELYRKVKVKEKAKSLKELEAERVLTGETMIKGE
ncbi:MAG: DNA-directed RNA polymerase subunit beta' [Synergistetes bacterium]|nr:DNA-directed RNA polymerase subunit beta' [Synergistota bacterium]MCX8127411.1 DNA-directed RNA polymerase subunit beta' [Synergistota bacterium]MDW8192275.1 DNA-directed RNA polymerase subunit beta' [Synergistota bacterium]